MSFNRFFKILVLATAFLFLAAITYIFNYNRSDEKESQIWLDRQFRFGSDKAPVKMILFEDFFCDECKNLTLYTLPLIKQKYVETGMVQLFIAPLGLLGNYHEALTHLHCLYQQSENLAESFLTNYLYLTHLDEPIRTQKALESCSDHEQLPLKSCLDGFNPMDFLDKNLEMAYKMMPDDLGVPTVFIQNIQLQYYDYKTIAEHIEKALGEKKELL